MEQSIAFPLNGHQELNLTSSLKQHAISLARSRIAILPLNSVQEDGSCTCQKDECQSKGKHPLTKNGLKDASIDLEVVADWWARWPCANIGIATGEISGIVVLDVDLKSGGIESLAKMEQKYGTLADHFQVNSGGGGKHYYFKAPMYVLKNNAS